MSILKYKDPKTGEFKRINPYKADLSFIGKDGIVVNKEHNSEMVEISGSGLVQNYNGPKGYYRAYVTDYTNWNTNMIICQEGDNSANTLLQRKADGSGEIVMPENPVDLSITNKKYVADNYVEKVKFTNLEQALNGYILDTTKETYADLDSAVLKNSVAVGNNVYPIADKTRALVTRIEGKTAKMVQLFDKSVIPATKTVNGITYTNNNDGSITINGTATAESYIIIVARDKVTNGNKILYGSEQNASDYGVAWGTNLYSSKFITATTSNNYTVIVKSGVTVDNVKIYPQLFDLTAMGREDITSAEQFKAEFPDLYPYENGNIYPAKISGVKFYEKQDKSGEQASVTLPETYDLHGIGDYKDYLDITKNENNDLYTLKKIQAIDKHVFDGTETWAVYNRVNFENVAFRTTLLADKYTGWYSRGNLMNLLVNIKTLSADKKGYTHGDNSSNIYISLPNIATPAEMKAHVLAMYEAGTPYIFYGAIATPVETVIATNLTYEQVTAIRHNGGLIEVEDNTNKGYAKPTIKNTVVYRLTATNTAEV